MQQKNGLRTFRPNLANYTFANADIEKQVNNWKQGVTEGTATRSLLLSGPVGLGKTTLSLALGEALGADSRDIIEVNCGSTRTLENTREQLLPQLNLLPNYGAYRILLLDEVHQMVELAQKAFLTPLEKLDKRIIVIACTSNPEILEEAFRSRFYEIRLAPYPEEALAEILENLPKPPKANQIATIVKAANGNPRRAIGMAEGGIGPEDQRIINTLRAIELFYPMLLAGQYEVLIHAINQITETEKRNFFDKTLMLLEGTWMTLQGQPTTLLAGDQKKVTTVLANMKIQPEPKNIAHLYESLVNLQDKSLIHTKSWLMKLTGN